MLPRKKVEAVFLNLRRRRAAERPLQLQLLHTDNEGAGFEPPSLDLTSQTNVVRTLLSKSISLSSV